MVHFGKWGCGASCICRDLVLIKFVDFVSFVAHYLVPSEVWQRLDKVFHLFKCIYWASSMLSLTHFSNENFFSRRKIWTSQFQWEKSFFSITILIRYQDMKNSLFSSWRKKIVPYSYALVKTTWYCVLLISDWSNITKKKSDDFFLFFVLTV